MPDGRPALLVVSPDVGLDTIAGERLRKLTAAFDDEGWRLIGITPPARDYLSSHARWPDSFVVHRTFALDPWTLGVRLKRRRSGEHRHADAARRRAAAGCTGGRRREQGEGGAAPRLAVPVGRLGSVRRRARDRGRASRAAGRACSRRSRRRRRTSRRSRCTGRRGVPWIADFRDPWTWRDRHGYNWSADRRGAAATERAVLRHASALTTIGPSLGAELAEHAGREVVVLPHGIPRRAASTRRRARDVRAARARARRHGERAVRGSHAGRAGAAPAARARHAGAADALRAGRVPPARARPRGGARARAR